MALARWVQDQLHDIMGFTDKTVAEYFVALGWCTPLYCLYPSCVHVCVGQPASPCGWSHFPLNQCVLVHVVQPRKQSHRMPWLPSCQRTMFP